MNDQSEIHNYLRNLQIRQEEYLKNNCKDIILSLLIFARQF